MKRKEVIEEICSILDDLSSGEYIQLIDDLKKQKDDENKIPKIYGMDVNKNFKNKKSDGFDETAFYFIINDSNEKESANYPQDLVDPEKIANFLLRLHNVKTEYAEIDILVEDYWENTKAVLEFLGKIPEPALLALWSEYQKEIGEEERIYEMSKFDELADRKYSPSDLLKHTKEFNPDDPYFIITDGNFKSSKHLEFLINVVELANYYQ